MNHDGTMMPGAGNGFAARTNAMARRDTSSLSGCDYMTRRRLTSPDKATRDAIVDQR